MPKEWDVASLLDAKERPTDLAIVDQVLNGAECVAIKKMSRNDRDWADNRNKHQNGPYITDEIQSGDFFPELERRSDKPHIYDLSIRTYWPSGGA